MQYFPILQTSPGPGWYDVTPISRPGSRSGPPFLSSASRVSNKTERFQVGGGHVSGALRQKMMEVSRKRAYAYLLCAAMLLCDEWGAHMMYHLQAQTYLFFSYVSPNSVSLGQATTTSRKRTRKPSMAINLSSTLRHKDICTNPKGTNTYSKINLYMHTVCVTILTIKQTELTCWPYNGKHCG